MTASEIVAKRLGAPTTEIENPETTSVATNATRILRQEPTRVAFVLINLGLNTLYLAPTDSVSSSRGIAVAANGGSLSMDIQEDFTLPAREWWAIAPAGADNIYILSLTTLRPTPTPPPA